MERKNDSLDASDQSDDQDDENVVSLSGNSQKLDTVVQIIESKIEKDHEKDKKHVNYIIQVKHTSGASWRVSRRYTKFENLHHDLQLITKSTLPKLPPKSRKRNFKDSYIDKQREKLNSYLVKLAANAEVNQSTPWCSFLVGTFQDLFEHINTKKSDQNSWEQKYQQLVREKHEVDIGLRERTRIIEQHNVDKEQYEEVSQAQQMKELANVNQKCEAKVIEITAELQALRKEQEISNNKIKQLEELVNRLQQQKHVLIAEVKKQRVALGHASGRTGRQESVLTKIAVSDKAGQTSKNSSRENKRT